MSSEETIMLKGRNELLTSASLEDIREAAREVLGDFIEEDKGDRITFTEPIPTCPAQIVAIKEPDGKFRIYTTSICSIENCQYVAKCIKMDVANLKLMKELLLKERPGVEIKEFEWNPTRVKEDIKLQKALDLLHRKK